jgi:CelD/BcsL family acetyltransferase involved in cellulose biosynthesis
MSGQLLIPRQDMVTSHEQTIPKPLLTVEGHRGGVEVVDSIAAEWRELCAEAYNDQPFFRPEWVGAYLRAFAPCKPILLITARVDGRLKAVLPLVEEQAWHWGVPVRKLRSAANVHCLRFDLIRSTTRESRLATQAIWEFLTDSITWDLFEMEHVLAGAPLEDLVSTAYANGFAVARRESWHAPYIPILGGNPAGESWLQGTDPKFRANLRRRWRNLSAQGTLTLQRFDKADPQILQRFYEVERSGWKGRSGSAITLDQHTQQFYDEIAKVAEQFNYLSIYILESNGRDVAAQFGLSYGGRYFLLKPAYDEAYSQYSPGQLLVHAVLEDCVKRGCTEFDFLGASDNWKKDWTSHARVQNVWYVFNKTRKGRALDVLVSAIKHARNTILDRRSHVLNSI